MMLETNDKIASNPQTQIQVFVSSTHGLIEIQSISKLQNTKLRSVASINFSSQLAGISQQYANFVSQPQGIIQSHYGMHEYRLNLSGDIEQGNSWQLGVYLAHLLKQHGFLYSCSRPPSILPDASSSTNDIKLQAPAAKTAQTTQVDFADANLIVIASGAVNTESEDVMSIGHLAKKCETANGQIRQWQSEGKKLVFLVPFENYKDPIPDSNIPLCPVKHLSQLPSLLGTLLDLPSSMVNQLGAGDDLEDKAPLQNEAYRTTKPSNEPTGGVTIEAEERGGVFDFTSFAPSLYLVFGCVFVLLCLVYFTFFTEADSNEGSLQGLEYRLTAVLSQNKEACRLAIELAQSESSHNPAANQYLASINGGDANGISELRHFNEAPMSSSANLCQLTLHTSTQVKGLWMVSKQTGLLNILPIVMPNKNHHWSIPIIQASNQASRYHLLLFTEGPDAADFQSLESYLSRQPNQQNLPSAEALSQWSRQLALPVVFLSHQIQ